MNIKNNIMKRTQLLATLCLILIAGCPGTLRSQQLPEPFRHEAATVRTTELTCSYLTPKKIVWTSNEQLVTNPQSVLRPGIGQADLISRDFLQLKSNATEMGAIVLDFGREIHGGLQIITTANNKNTAGRVRIRFGESVAEACCNVGEHGATNDHAIRDQIITLPWLGSIKIGDTGFRFVRIDMVDPETTIEIKEINASFVYRDIPYLGSFRCDDETLNTIWMTGAYTVHLNMQDYLWDGIKRDRLVWVGDLHPEVMTVNTVFGQNEVVPRSLDLIRELTPLPGWMNGTSSYSMWWILIQRDWYYYHGDLNYLKEQRHYLSDLLKLFASKIDANGKEALEGWRFLDWPSSENNEAIDAGLQALMVMSFRAGLDLSAALDDREMTQVCKDALKKLGKHRPQLAASKQAAALQALAGLISPTVANKEVLSKDGAHRMSTFYGYYILNAMAEADNVQGGMDVIKEYWGSMLKLGATTFWEDFDIDWMKNAGRIDEMPTEDKVNVHASYGNYCYKGYRHSLCHGWASGPTSWLSRYVLGVEPLEPGCKTVRIRPHLGQLKWVEGTFPTPYGVIKIKHTNRNGKVTTEIDAPKEVKIVR